MPTLTKYQPRSEKELHVIIQRELDALEVGMRLLKHEFAISAGYVDFLCADSGGCLVVIEVKLSADDNILFQALRYFSDVDRDRYLIATLFNAASIDPSSAPRILLIAEQFSDDLRRLSTLVTPDVELYEYAVFVDPDGRKGIHYKLVALPVDVRPPSAPKTVEDLIDYLTAGELKSVVADARRDIRAISPHIEEYPTRSYIGYKHSSGRQVAYIKIMRRSIEVGAHVVDEKGGLLRYDGVLVSTPDDGYGDALERIGETIAVLDALHRAA